MRLRRATLGLLALLGCEHPATQLVLRVDSDLREGDELRAVQVTMRRTGASAAAFERAFDLTAGAYHLPGTLGVVPGDPDDARQLEVVVRAVLRDAEGFETRAIVSFQPGETLLLDLFLASRCRDPENRAGCSPAETCGPRGCEPVVRATLPGFTGPTARLDAGAPDAPATADAGQLDAGEPDAGEPDAGEPDAGEPDAGEPDAPTRVGDAACGPGSSCCAGGVACGAGSVCADVDGGATRCTACGALGQPCCAGGACDPSATPCARLACGSSGRCGTAASTDGTPCGAVGYGAWDTCAYGSTCDRSGTQRRSVSTPRCMSGACAGVSSTETRACTRSTDGAACGSTGYGAWGACGGFTTTCDTDGTQSRAVTSYRCAGGACAGSTSTGSQSCTRATANNPCTWMLGTRTCGGVCASGSCSPTCGRPGCPC